MVDNLDEKDFLIIGITGGIGSGKTSAAKYIESLGYPVIYTDMLAKKVMNSDENVINEIKRAFGNDVYLDSGELNSAKLSNIVFDINAQNNEKLTKLNRIVHPPTIDLMMKEIEVFLEEGSELVFVESALIYEAGLEDGFDYVIVIDADEEVRIERTSERLKLSSEEIRRRNSQQISTTMKKNMADFVIENNGDVEQLYKNIDFVLSIIKMA